MLRFQGFFTSKRTLATLSETPVLTSRKYEVKKSMNFSNLSQTLKGFWLYSTAFALGKSLCFKNTKFSGFFYL